MWSIPLYGSLAIHGYGTAICCGAIIAIWCATRHTWCREKIGVSRFLDAIYYASIWGVIGARVLHVATEWHTYTTWSEIITLWAGGGLSVLGTVGAMLFFLPWYCTQHQIPLVPMLDLCGLYAPLAHAISRLGCWSAGCCAGVACTLPWAITDESGQLVHPTQWYSALCFIIGFCVLQYMTFHYRPGLIIALYICLVGCERYTVDWWRSDRVFMKHLPVLSVHQYGALLLLLIGVTMLWVLYHRQYNYHESLPSS